MPQINLTTLSGQELRQRLDSSRARGDAALAYEILREMAARRAVESGRRPLLKRRPAEPRIVEVDLGDPEDRDDDLPAMPHWRAPEFVAAAAPTDPDDFPHFRRLDVPLTLGEPEPGPEIAEPLSLRLASVPEESAEPRPQRGARSGHRSRVVAGFAVGVTAGAALGWFAADLNRTPGLRAAPPIQVAAQRAPSAPAVLEVVAETPAPPVEVAEVAVAPTGDSTPANDVAPTAPAPADVADVSPPQTAPSQTAPSGATDGCTGEPTSADRAICADPALQQLQRDLRRAYAEALDAHEDRALLRQRQLAWRDARNDVTEPGRLARLYEERIRKLDAAAAAARAAR